MWVQHDEVDCGAEFPFLHYFLPTGNPTLVTVDNAQYVWGLNLTDLQFSVLQANLVEGRLW